MCLRKLTSSRSVNLRPDAGVRRGTLYVPLRSAHTFSNVQTVAQFNGVEQVGVNTLEVSVMRTRLKRSCSSAACRWFSASVPAYGRYRNLLPSQAHFVADLRPVFAAILVNRSFRRCSTPAACASIAASLPYRQLLHALSLVHRPDGRRPPFRQGVGAQTVCTVQTNRGTSPTANRPLMRVSQF